VTVDASMVEVVDTPRTGWSMASDAGNSFALDTELNDDLRLEGAAREIVRAVNDLRKSANLALDSRVRLGLRLEPGDLRARLDDAGWLDYVAREVLADAIEDDAGPDAVEVDLGDLGRAYVSIA
jgi:isoleucyl-tRNA synthetase